MKFRGFAEVFLPGQDIVQSRPLPGQNYYDRLSEADRLPVPDLCISVPGQKSQIERLIDWGLIRLVIQYHVVHFLSAYLGRKAEGADWKACHTPRLTPYHVCGTERPRS